MNKQVNQYSTCGSLGLPPDLACIWCVPSISRPLQKGIAPRKIKKCIRPWISKRGNHRETEKVRVLKKVIKFLGDDNGIGDILVDTYLYKETSKPTNKTIEESHDDINFSLQSKISTSPHLLNQLQ